ncbi:SAM-dependent methyltransferase [Streptomyces sp. NPDC058409]|uniref:SAM-dependent methyltransferase n=1 Tax=Streptomyces sp. NPDC058409 TaxID=3346484 RepID=UPI0036559DDC
MNAPAPAVDANSTAQGATPSTARITDWLLGGERHHQPADRRLGIRVLNAAPWTNEALELNRQYAHQTVAMLRACGIRQFVDLGSGLPTLNPRFPHTALSAGPDTTVIHVDCDPYVIEHGPQLLSSLPQPLSSWPGLHRFMHADLRNMLQILRELPLHGLDPSQPAGFLLHDVLPWIPDNADARASVGAILDGAPPGSVLSLTHSTADLCRDGSAAAAARCFSAAGLPVRLRTAEEISELTEASARPWHVRAPGIVPVGLYHPTRYRAPVPHHHSGGGYAVILLHPEPAHH